MVLSLRASVILNRPEGARVRTTQNSTRPWPVRAVPALLRERYLATGWWRDETLGAFVDRSLAAVHAEARRLAGGLHNAGIQPDDVDRAAFSATGVDFKSRGPAIHAGSEGAAR